MRDRGCSSIKAGEEKERRKETGERNPYLGESLTEESPNTPKWLKQPARRGDKRRGNILRGGGGEKF